MNIFKKIFRRLQRHLLFLPLRFLYLIRCAALFAQISLYRLIFHSLSNSQSTKFSIKLRNIIRSQISGEKISAGFDSQTALLSELSILEKDHFFLKYIFNSLRSRRVLYPGQAYYNSWFLSRSLRNLGWNADLLNWDLNSASQIYYHGQDFQFQNCEPYDLLFDLRFYTAAIYNYDVFHFANSNAICFGYPLQNLISQKFQPNFEIFLLKSLGKIVVYSNNGCMDGVSQTSFSKWGPDSVCAICRWRDEPTVCSDEGNLSWGKFRNTVSDYQCLLGGNRTDFNFSPTVHESPEFYCLDDSLWKPDIEIPEKYRLARPSSETIRLYHAVGNKADRTDVNGVNIKSSHVYGPLIEKLKLEGFKLETLEPTGIPNKEVRFIQAQADIFLEMLTYGWFGANAREAMMLGKPVICFIRPEWLEDLRREIPEYAGELPIISATPNTVEGILRDLLINPEKRKEIGLRSREFAVKWHSSVAGGKKFDEIYSKLLTGDPLLIKEYSRKAP